MIASLVVNCLSRYWLISQSISLGLTFKNTTPSIDWSLRKVFVKEDLDLTVHSGEAFLSWRQQFKNFVQEAGIKAAIPWESQLAALEACVTTTTFSKIQAIQSQLPADQRKNLDTLLEATATLAQAADNVWLHRHAFDAYRQLPD